MSAVLRSPRAGSAKVEALLRAQEPGRDNELQLVGKGGTLFEVDVSSMPMELEGGALVSFLTRDLSDRKKAESALLATHQRLDKLAHHDHLTGLPNRMFLQAHLPTAIERSRTAGAMLAVLFLDLDRFKHINDSRGHEVGDKLLQEIATRVPMRCGRTMWSCAWAAMIHRGARADLRHGTGAGDRRAYQRALGAPVVIDGRALVATVSIA